MNIFQKITNFAKKALIPIASTRKKPFLFGRRTANGRNMDQYKIGAGTFFTIYKNNGDVYSVIREYQQNVLSKGFEFENVEDPDQEPDEDFVERANSILNFNSTFRDLKGNMLLHRFIAGNTYVNLLESKNDSLPRSERIIGLQTVDPRTMAIIATNTGEVISYKQKIKGQSDWITFEPEEIAHWKLGVDPDHELFGMSPLEPIIWEARTDIQAMIRNYFFFENNALPDAYFILDESIGGEEEIKKAIDDINNQFKGSDKSHKSTVLHGVKDVKTINISHKDMEFLGGRRFTTEKVCSAYGVSKVILNYTDGVNHATSQTQYQKFIENTVMPTDEDLVEFLNRCVFSRATLNGIPLTDKIKMKAKPQTIESQSEIERRAMLELDSGVLTRRQYKKKTGQELSPEDENEPMFDKHIIKGGASSVLLEDVGVDPFVDPNDNESAQKFLDQLENFKQKLNEKS